jgi:hypothetical protein
VCIVLASRSVKTKNDVPAKVLFQSLPEGHRTEKFAALDRLSLGGQGWVECHSEWRAPFLPALTGAWATFPALEDLFIYDGSGVMPGRVWIIAPDSESLLRRWQRLISAPAEEKETLFHPHQRHGKPGDKHSKKIVATPLAGFQPREIAVADETGPSLPPVPYAFRSFDRQWIFPDSRLINQSNPELWKARSDRQIFLTAPSDQTPTNGPALTATAFIPDLHHYAGRGGRTFPLWGNANATEPNIRPKLLTLLAEKFGAPVTAEDLIAYIVAVAAHSAFTAKFQKDLSTPGLRIPMTADHKIFAEAVELGRTVIWLHTFGDRMADAAKGRPDGPPRLSPAKRPKIPAGGAIPQEPDAMPDTIDYDANTKRLLVGKGYVENVPAAVWSYEVSGKQVLLQWFSYRKKNRDRPIIGGRREPSPLGKIQPDKWLAEYTSELINVLNVLGWLVDVEPEQAALLEKICTGPLLSADELKSAGAFELPPKPRGKSKSDATPDLFG